jgi:hypothetical protein
MPKIRLKSRQKKIIPMLSIILFSALLGWCGPFFGTKRPILGPDPNPVDPDPIRRTYSNPMPGITAGIIGMLGGIGGGIAIHSQVPSENLATVGLAALAGGKVLFDIVSGIRDMGR